MHIDCNNNPKNKYTLHETLLCEVDSECDLGVHTSAIFNWKENIKNSIAKANKMTAWIARNVVCRSQDVMLLIYKALVRPHIEYCVQIWSPVPRYGNWSVIIELENVQRKFTRLIDGVGLLNYGERLAKLNLTTLAERRLRADLIETYKIINDSVNYGKDLFTVSRSGHSLVCQAGVKSTSRRDFFAQRVIKYWNRLPTKVQLASSVDSFKRGLENYKRSCMYAEGNYWEVSWEIISKIDTPNAISGREDFNKYLQRNPWYARYRGINIYTPKLV